MHATDFVESYFDAWNHRDARMVADHLTIDGTYCDIPDQQQLSRDELVWNLAGYFDANKHRYEMIGEILTGSGCIAFRYRVLPSNTPEKTFSGAEFVTLDGDGALRILDYYGEPGADASPVVPDAGGGGRPKYARSGLSDEQMEAYRNRLTSLVRDEQIFLRPDLTLPVLAEHVGCSVNHLSQVINSSFGTSFTNYLNRYRVEHARQLLMQEENRQRSVLSIGFAAGFNSHSSFYSSFKEAYGQPPARFRRDREHPGDTR